MQSTLALRFRVAVVAAAIEAGRASHGCPFEAFGFCYSEAQVKSAMSNTVRLPLCCDQLPALPFVFRHRRRE